MDMSVQVFGGMVLCAYRLAVARHRRMDGLGRGSRLGDRRPGLDTLAETAAVPVAAVGIVFGVHRLMSSTFVALNVLGNALATIVISGWEGRSTARHWRRA